VSPVEREQRGEVIAWAVALTACLVALCLVGCATAEALGTAPPGAWQWVERVALALLDDVMSVVRLVVPL
jgi:hypothetical protein